MLRRKDEFVRNVSAKVPEYALGRSLRRDPLPRRRRPAVRIRGGGNRRRSASYHSSGTPNAHNVLSVVAKYTRPLAIVSPVRLPAALT